MEGLKESEANLVVYLHPSMAKCVNDAILRELSSLLFMYSETFDGVVLAYDPNVRSNLAKILPGIHPYLGVRLKAKLLLFSPKPNMLLEGEVVKISRQSIHAVILGFSSAVIADEDIRDEFKYKVKHGKEVFGSRHHKKHKIKVGTIIRFLVKSFDEEILHISGSLVAVHTGCARWLDTNLEEWSQADSTTRKRKDRDEKEQKIADDKMMANREMPFLKKDDRIKKLKKKRKEHT
ncbi:DNA-directed RNA polymerase [Abeliophyllum distichum]|uniref:DNA-directed RNA polymerase subunit n=1 Tax=Abeliophyllum distichum TaxID=126358 RepID=A0ABD1SVH3_9LAMI